jgi:hypothetical protein
MKTGEYRREVMRTKAKLRIGDWVEVRSKEEILQTLNGDGQLEGMPFMPEMFAFCGQKFQVYKMAHKTCDYSVYPYRARRLARAVHLQTRCDGAAHGGCQAACMLYWKEDWLKSPGERTDAPTPQLVQVQPQGNAHCQTPTGCTEDAVWRCVKESQTDDGTPTYICQMTQTPGATTPLAWWDPRQYLEDYLSGNVTLGRILSGLIYWVYYSLSQAGIGVGRPMRWLYDKLSPIWGGPLFPRKPGIIPEGQPTPSVKLNLQPGEMVRVKSHLEILQTIDSENRNRGMHWDAELVPYCGGTYQVLKRVTKIIGERTGKMQEMKSPCIILDSVVCQARYSSCRLFCPKSMYPYWREIWLERVEPVNRSKSEAGERGAVAVPANDCG